MRADLVRNLQASILFIAIVMLTSPAVAGLPADQCGDCYAETGDGSIRKQSACPVGMSHKDVWDSMVLEVAVMYPDIVTASRIRNRDATTMRVFAVIDQHIGGKYQCLGQRDSLREMGVDQ